MAQLILGDPVVSENGGNHNITIKVSLFADGVDVKIATPLMETEQSGLVKSHVEGLGIDDLVARAYKEIGEKVQVEVNKFIKLQEIVAKIDKKAISDRIDISKVVAEVKP